MRLLTWNGPNQISLTKDFSDDDAIPPYAILSHTWGDDSQEVTSADVENYQGQEKQGYQKITFCADRAKRDGYQHCWVDTCCINKDSQSELSEAITSMFRWYQNAAKCYVYLSDVSARKRDNDGDAQSAWQSSFRTSRWVTRGWTLQEVLAASIVEFFSREGDLLGTKETLICEIHEVTTIPRAALQHTPPSQFSIAERIRWTQNRNTKKKEDKAYCLLGLFSVFMPLIYGEGDNALRRLQKEINSQWGADVAGVLTQGHQTRSLGLCLSSAPLMPPNYFVGRGTEIEAISDVLRPDRPVTEQRRVVLGGIGGVGKTQLALAYTRQHQSSYTSVIWLNATSQSTLHLSLRSVTKGFIAAEELDKLDDQQTLARFHEWLSSPQNARWLLIFDNYDEPDDFEVDYFCPNIGQGAILVTTRLPDRVTGLSVRVRPLQDIDNSLDVLQVRSGRKDVKKEVGAYRLAERLGGLPLALVTAGTYLCKSTITFQQYLDAYEQRWQVDRRRLLYLPEYRDRTLYTTWNLSYTRLEHDDPAAAQMLRLLAYFDHQDIWYELLSAGRTQNLSPMLQQVLTDQIDFESVMTTLVDYCFLEVQTSTRSYVMHSCVHDWALAGLNETLHPPLYWYSFDCVAASIDQGDWDSFSHHKYSRLVPHASRLVCPRFIKDEALQLNAGDLNDAIYIAQMLKQQVQLFAAEKVYLRALAGCETALGPDHISTLITVNNLGLLYYNQDKLKEAEQMYQRALAGYETALGPDHTSTLDTVHNLGILYSDQDKSEEAEQMYLRALAGKENQLGPDHTSTLGIVNSLGVLYRTQGKLEEAEHMYLRTLTGYEKALGPDHTLTLSTVNNFGSLYYYQGKLKEAERMLLRALAGKETVLGSDHTSTLDTVHNLGVLYRTQGKLEAAEQMYLRAVAGYEKALGPDHTSTLDSEHCLTSLYSQRGQLDQVESMY